MAYRIKIMPRAKRDLSSLYDWLDAGSSDAAPTWYLGLKDAIRTLGGTSTRVIYRVIEKQRQIDVLHIRHGARRKFKPADLA